MAIQTTASSKYKPDINLPPDFMRDMGKLEIALIKADFDEGITQNETGKRTSPYSLQYKKYKQNWMRRFTTRRYGAKTRVKGKVMTSTKAYTANQGTLLKGQSEVVNNKTNVKNYKLTGYLFNRLKIESVKQNEVVLTYDQLDVNKILGAEAHGDQIVGLNNDNQETIKEAIFQEMSKNIDDWCREDINLTVTIL
jgi:hypothetical protein